MLLRKISFLRLKSELPTPVSYSALSSAKATDRSLLWPWGCARVDWQGS